MWVLALCTGWQTRLHAEDEFSIRDANDNMLYEGKSSTGNYYLPAQLVSASRSPTSISPGWRIAAAQQWEGLNGKQTDFKYVNSQRFAGGMGVFVLQILLRQENGAFVHPGGIELSLSGYIQVKGEKINDFGFAGASLPSRTGHLRYYSLEGGGSAALPPTASTEPYFTSLLHLGLRDSWFLQTQGIDKHGPAVKGIPYFSNLIRR